ncbi:MAG TPA: prephenate dehydratase [Caulobacteraceae bacterium]|nr:prephenate dehydratase [Caulobacteraceae bacterium]
MSKPAIAYQGEPGAFSHEACRAWAPAYEPLACPTFEDAFDAVQSGRVALGMIPVENTVAGRVTDVHHLLPKSGLRIVGEHFLPIHMQLMGVPGSRLEDIRVAASHPMALLQCRRTLRKLGLQAEVVGDTAGAAKALAERPDPTRAAIASAVAAELYGLKILKKDIEDAHGNTTRFLVLTAEREPALPPAGVPCVTSFVFKVKNQPAALYKALGGFATGGVNMTKLESYTEDGGFASTVFYCEVEGRPDDPAAARAFDEVRFFSTRFEVLGVYPSDPARRGEAR